MSNSRTQWHVLFYAALKEHGPRSVEVLAEVVLSAEPQVLSRLAPGYYLMETRPYRLLVVDLSEVVAAEKDEWMAILVPSTMLSARARRWLEEHMPMKDVSPDDKLEGHDEVLERLLQSLTPEEILKAAGTTRLLESLPPEQRLAGLAPEDMLLALPEGALRALSDDYVRTLPVEVQAAIRRRLGTTPRE